MIFLDYDGTLVGYNEKPELAIPDNFLLKILEKLLEFPSTELAIVSGREQDFLDQWFGHLPITLVAQARLFHQAQKSKMGRKRNTA